MPTACSASRTAASAPVACSGSRLAVSARALAGRPFQARPLVQCHRRRCRRHRSAVETCAIGFDLPGAESNNKSAEKHAEELTRAAASLLLFSSTLRGKPAQAFLSVLQLLQKGNPLSLVQAAGELYRLLAADGHASWQDYLLDQVIRGADNPLAKAAAAGKPTQHLHRAAANDLDLLQQLAVADRTLATWVKESAYGTSEEWLEAAASLAPPAGHGVEPQAVHEALLAPGGPPRQLAAPLTEAQRAGLRAELAGKWRWSEGVELLSRYWATHGAGLVSQHSVLAWTGKLQAQDVLKGAHELAAAEEQGLVAPHHHAATTLLAALSEFLRQDPSAAAAPPHVAVCGGAADRWLYTVWALQQLPGHVAAELAPAAAGLRTLVVPASQLGGLSDLAWSLSQHPRARFAVVINSGLDGLGRAEGDVAAMLSGYDGFSWPANALLIAGFPVKLPEELATVFGGRVATVEDRVAA